MIGKTLAHYEITELLGEGGMGQVYQARDTRLGRNVAVKVLPEIFANDGDRVARFEREAKVLASLNHPNIAALYGVEESEHKHFLVMELVDGETIAARLGRGPYAVDEAIRISCQIAEALEAAHEKGVVHRDLKPANVKITTEGKVKVLDFGLAKAMDSSPANPNVSNSPTLSFAATQAGVILGTAAYMSPEQVKGFQADARSDVFSFGCVLYEMLTGRQAFIGETAAEIMANVLVREPDLAALSNLDARLRDVVKRCLDKNPKRRYHAIADLRIELERIAAEPDTGSVAAVAAVSQAPLWKRPLAFAATAILTGSIVGVVVWNLRPADVPAVVQFSVMPPDKTAFASENRIGPHAAISPDGRKLAFTVRNIDGKTSLWVRPIDALTAQPLPGTDGASFPFWSPDSRFIAYFAPNKLQKIDSTGGPPQTLCLTPAQGRGGAWGPDGTIIFSTSNLGLGLHRVSSAGGETAVITKLASGEADHRFPSFLVDGRHFIFYVNGGAERQVEVGSLDSSEIKVLIRNTNGAVFAPPDSVIFNRDGTLFAQHIDLKKFEMLGDPVPIADRIDSQFSGHTSFSASKNGVLAYGAGSGGGSEIHMLTWVDRSGKVIETVGKPGTYKGLDLSPDGKRVALHTESGPGLGDIWLLDLARGGAMTRFTFDSNQHSSNPIWSPDGAEIVFNAVHNGKVGIYKKTSSGAGNDELLLELSEKTVGPISWFPDGRSILYQEVDNKTRGDLSILPLMGDKKPLVFQNSEFLESHGQISPDGKWIAFNSLASGSMEVYVRPFPTGSGQWQVSTNGGGFPRWRGDSKELFYMDSPPRGGKMMAVEIHANGSSLAPASPVELFDSQYVDGGGHGTGNYHTFAVSPDGQRFLIPRAAGGADASANPVVVVLNWPAAIKN